mmetsp:Transcript_74287/g.119896  ORF Transcript_74287/g.119896 Transcript_74287/m.119896 type:complete len:82 (-) Transcript_74287:551-796(-)
MFPQGATAMLAIAVVSEQFPPHLTSLAVVWLSLVRQIPKEKAFHQAAVVRAGMLAGWLQVLLCLFILASVFQSRVRTIHVG